MNQEHTVFSSGIPSLDETLQGIQAGDNIVFQVDAVQDFLPFVHRFCQHANQSGQPLIYFQFADHSSFLPDGGMATGYRLDPQAGFEQFISGILEAIEHHGQGGYYVFDCLSGLAVDWYTDRMLGNFFRLTCPYLYTYGAVAYFVLLRNLHRPLAINTIHATAQVVLEVFRRDDMLYIHPTKVAGRHSTTMYMLHSWKDDLFRPVTKSVVLSEILSSMTQPSIDFDSELKDIWTKTLLQAQDMEKEFRHIGKFPDEAETLKSHLIKMLVTRDAHLGRLCEHYFKLPDLVAIGKRMIGSGLIGGKAVGMLLARRILAEEDENLYNKLEMHDSFFIGSDVFYTYIIQNDCWWERHRLKQAEDVFEHAKHIQHRLLTGKFDLDIMDQFKDMLNYYGQSPIIVRSSSLLEDAYGNSFAGKYESIFCANQGTPEERLSDFIKAVQTIYASTMSKEALSYRVHRGLLDQDEQMALLVQRVSGEFYQHLYFPQIAGVGYSFNPFVWHQKIDPEQGMLRLVFGLGTRAVERHDDDYTRVVALNEPGLRPEGTSADEIRRYSQKIVNVLDLDVNKHVSYTFEKVAQIATDIPLHLFATRDTEMETRAKQFGIKNVFSYVLDFEELLKHTPFVSEMKAILTGLSKVYEHPVDVEFTVNFFNATDYRIHLLQCRPFQFAGKIKHQRIPKNVPKEDIIVKTHGPVIGQSITEQIEQIIYVIPEKYGKMLMNERYAVARLIGKLINLYDHQRNIMLIGPGRWGTKVPALGIPVSFSEIQNASVLCEIAIMHEGLTPDLSLGTHFFNDIVEMNILYIGVSPEKEGALFNEQLLQNVPNRLPQLLPDSVAFADSVVVLETTDIRPNASVFLCADTLAQKGLIFVSEKTKMT